MREFDVLDAIMEELTAYTGAKKTFAEDERRLGWQESPVPFISFNPTVLPDMKQPAAQRYLSWKKVDDASDGAYQYKVETTYRHKPHLVLSINCYGGWSPVETTAEYVAQMVRQWFLGVGHLAMDELHVRAYRVGQALKMPNEYNAAQDALSRYQMDVELVVPIEFANRIESIEKAVIKPTVKVSEEDEGQEWPYSSVFTDDYIEPS